MDTNELIAEKVMGEPKPTELPEWDIAFNGWISGRPEMSKGENWMCATLYSHNDVPEWIPLNFMGHIECAWRVVEKMWEIFPGLVITRWFSGEGAPYLVSLGNRNHGKEMGSAEETSITHAICFAALRAVGVEEEILKRLSELPQRSL